MQKIKILLFLPLVIWGLNTKAQRHAEQEHHYNLKKNVALMGYDAVSYFKNGPVKGSPSVSSNYLGVIYHFHSEENKKEFESNPEKYQPAYGGWCAYAMALKGKKVKIAPESYLISDNRLLLFYNFGSNNTLDRWKPNAERFEEQADENWAEITIE